MAKTDQPQRVSDILRETRLRQKRDLADVSAVLRIRENHLIALEENNMEVLPSATYVIGFIRTYAHYLDIDSEKLIDMYKQENAHSFNNNFDFLHSFEEQKQFSPLFLIGGICVFLMIIYFGWLLLINAENVIHDRAQDYQRERVFVEQSIATESMDMSEESMNRLAIRAQNRIWVRIERLSGQLLFASIMQKGDYFFLPEGERFMVTTQNAGHLEYVVNDVVVRSVGQKGEFLKRHEFFVSKIIEQAK